MALSKSIFFTDISGVEREVQGAYIAVYGIRSSKLQAIAQVSTKTGKDGNLLYEAEYAFVPDYTDDAKNLLAQAYAYIKTLPELAGSIDC